MLANKRYRNNNLNHKPYNRTVLSSPRQFSQHNSNSSLSLSLSPLSLNALTAVVCSGFDRNQDSNKLISTYTDVYNTIFSHKQHQNTLNYTTESLTHRTYHYNQRISRKIHIYNCPHNCFTDAWPSKAAQAIPTEILNRHVVLPPIRY